MKKIVTILLAAAMLLSCAVVFSSCAIFTPKPELDLEDAADNLEDADYYVSYTDDEDNLSVGMEESLSASSDDGDDGLYIVKYADAKSASIAYDEAKMEIDNAKEEIKLSIKKYENILKKYEDDLDSDEIDYYEDLIKDLEDELEEYDEYVIGKSGKTVWYGTKDAIEDSKG